MIETILSIIAILIAVPTFVLQVIYIIREAKEAKNRVALIVDVKRKLLINSLNQFVYIKRLEINNCVLDPVTSLQLPNCLLGAGGVVDIPVAGSFTYRIEYVFDNHLYTIKN